MALTHNARELLDLLPEDGSSISGGNIRFELEIGAEELRQAKTELKDAGLVKLGRGRGGTVSRVIGEEAPKVVPQIAPVAPKKQMEFARQAKDAKAAERKELGGLRERITKFVGKELGFPIVWDPDNNVGRDPETNKERINVTFYGVGADEEIIIEVRHVKDAGSDMYRLKEA